LFRGAGAVVLALPRGGVPVGLEVAQKLGVPLDVFVVRKLGLPSQPELAMGAIASGGVRVLNDDVVAHFGIAREAVEQVTRNEAVELARREKDYRQNRPPADVTNRTAILVDDGLATGFTMRAAIVAVKQLRLARLVVAAPVGARDTCAELAHLVDALICPLQPRSLFAIAQWYDEFEQTTDEEVRSCLARAIG
jgi:predicted phosphoribosyltransferase